MHACCVELIKANGHEHDSAALYCVPASEHGVEGDDEVFLLLGEVLVLQVGTQVVGVPQPAALAAPLEPCASSHHAAPSASVAPRHQPQTKQQNICMVHGGTITCSLGHVGPVAGAMGGGVGQQLGVLLRRPRPLLHVRLVAARRPPHRRRRRRRPTTAGELERALTDA
jgi:hypothetical protein